MLNLYSINIKEIENNDFYDGGLTLVSAPKREKIKKYYFMAAEYRNFIYFLL